MNMLLPLWVVLALLGWGNLGPDAGNTHHAASDLGLSAQQIEGRYVEFVARPPVETSLGGEWWGVACVHRPEALATMIPALRLGCAALPVDAAIVFTEIWPMNPMREAYTVRHEIQHVIDGPSPGGWSALDEVGPTRAGCAVADIGASVCGGG